MAGSDSPSVDIRPIRRSQALHSLYEFKACCVASIKLLTIFATDSKMDVMKSDLHTLTTAKGGRTARTRCTRWTRGTRGTLGTNHNCAASSFVTNRLAVLRPTGQSEAWCRSCSVMYEICTCLHTIDTHGRNRDDFYKTKRFDIETDENIRRVQNGCSWFRVRKRVFSRARPARRIPCTTGI